VNPATHLNGVLDVTGGGTGLACTSCHGDPTRASNPAAPPTDTLGNTATTAPGVGAHQSHLGSTLRAGAVACTDCHVVPTSTSHSNGVVQVTFSGTATLNGQAPAWSAATLTCATTYCHASSLTTGGTARAPVWNQVDGTQKTCSSCHGAPPPSGHHSTHAGRSCGNCHGGYSTTTVNAATHIDGSRSVGGAGSSITSWNAATMTCTNTCHSSRTW
jgi:predicted CxxxxCH...CXXCH cytochrome family protein